jgi:site-specific DNA-methyltransferase (adenine-specific)
MWTELKRIIKPNGAIVLFGSEPFSSALRISNIKNYKYDLIWDKNKGSQPQLAKIQPMKSHENISIFGNGKIIYNPQMEIGKPYIRNNKGSSEKDNMIKSLKPIKQINTGFRYPKTVLTFSRDFSAQTRLHPTQKPVELLEYLIKTYTNKNETVLDFTMGSGTTGVACKNLNRNFIGIELDETYFNIAKERIGD